MDDDQTRLAPSSGTPPTDATRTSASSGWLSTSGSIDHGRFTPGTILDNRYRIIGLVGRGGMGEVYRADDLRLGQPVALKFLPESLSRDTVRLAQFHNEVRTARQVSHTNVCRVYDIGELNGQLFLTMEYVDGEDLSSLLRRIGRLPEDKALEIARQMCAGLAAAHERGILHRDLKPANVMLDGAGKVRLMDFSLAAVGHVVDVRAGTPAYMAPEQIEGREVTVQSDIYALGLVIYELFTGRRAFTAKTLADLIEQHHTGTITAPTEIVPSLDVAVERAILRCLDPEPPRRPASALAVSMALPGGDPLAAAIAAGETPSPEMVAALGGESATMTHAQSWAWFAATTVMLIACAFFADRTSLFSRLLFQKPPAVLIDHAEDIRETLGYTDPIVDRAWGFSTADAYLTWVLHNGDRKTHWDEFAAARPAPVVFWYRTSPRALVPLGYGGISSADPPPDLGGMTSIQMDTAGRLLNLVAAPPEVESSPAAAVVPADWTKVFAAAGLDPAAFTAATPTRTPPRFADDRRAWTGALPGTGIRVRVEAASYRGKPTYFTLITPWSEANRGIPVESQGRLATLFVVAMLLGSAMLTRVNLRSGRADRRGAFRLAAAMTVLTASVWLFTRHLNAISAEWQAAVIRFGVSMFVGGAMYIVYLAIEPFVRRSWPKALVGWSRVLAGRVRDAVVGRDIAIGIAAGAALSLLEYLYNWLPGVLDGSGVPIPHLPQVTSLLGARALAATTAVAMNFGLQNGLIFILEFVLFRVVVQWLLRQAARSLRFAPAAERAMSRLASADWLVVIAAVLLSTLAQGTPAPYVGWTTLLYNSLSMIILLLVSVRIGVLAAVATYTVNALLTRVPLTLDGSRVYAGNAWFVLGALALLTYLGTTLARTGMPAGRRV